MSTDVLVEHWESRPHLVVITMDCGHGVVVWADPAAPKGKVPVPRVCQLAKLMREPCSPCRRQEPGQMDLFA